MPPFELSSSFAVAERRLSRGASRAERDVAPGAALRWESLPAEVKDAFYNLGSPPPETRLSAAQVAFHCFNYGEVRALSFASGLPLVSLREASELTGWRPKGLALLRAVLQRRSAGA